MFSGNQQQRRARSERLKAVVWATAFFLLAVLVMGWRMGDIPAEDRPERWTFFVICAAVALVVTAALMWKNAARIEAADEPKVKGMYWLAFVGLLLSNVLDRVFPDLKVPIYGLFAGVMLGAAIVSLVLLFRAPASNS